MTKEEIINSIPLKKHFCKIYELPITVFDNPYFYERLKTFDVLENCLIKFDIFCRDLLRFSDEYEYFKYLQGVKYTMADFIKSTPDYKAFVKENYKRELNIPMEHLYSEQNDENTFISIKMKKADFVAMKHYSKNIFDNSEIWEQFVCKFTPFKHVLNNNNIRREVLGFCGREKQVEYEYHLMSILYNYMRDHLPNIFIFSVSEDEILIKVPNHKIGVSIKEIKNIINYCKDGIGNLVDVKSFGLYKIEDWWMKTYNDDSNKVEFKFINPEIYNQVVKYYFGQPIIDNDLVFSHNGRLVKFLKEIDNPFII